MLATLAASAVLAGCMPVALGAGVGLIAGLSSGAEIKSAQRASYCTAGGIERLEADRPWYGLDTYEQRAEFLDRFCEGYSGYYEVRTADPVDYTGYTLFSSQEVRCKENGEDPWCLAHCTWVHGFLSHCREAE
jgi:hypothetical protein